MDELSKQVDALSSEVNVAVGRLKISELQAELQGLRLASQESGFWDDTNKAQTTMKRLSELDNRTQPWLELQQAIREAAELIVLDDRSLETELHQQIEKFSTDFNALKEQLKFNGPYDDHAAILTLSAGAGGTDAQDWTQMLLRMYQRYAENNRWKVTVIDESPGEEAGLKSVTLEIDGEFAYGKLQSEHGVHRLVRLSPFNAESRETSFAKAEVMPKIDRPDEVELDDKDLKIDVYRSGGHGGQSVNTTDSAVRVTHLPTGITVAIQNERSQLQNRETAMSIIRGRLAQLQVEQHAAQLSELKGPNEQAAWGNQIRSYVLHPYKQVKDLRTGYETSDPDKVLDGHLDDLINAYLEHNLQN